MDTVYMNFDNVTQKGAIADIMRFLDSGLKVKIYSSRQKSLLWRWRAKRTFRRLLAEYLSGDHEATNVEAVCWGDVDTIMLLIGWPWFKPKIGEVK
jgi:hypothetical protein